MGAGAGWFDEMRLPDAAKLQIKRRDANPLFSLKLRPLSTSVVAEFAS